jgi:hypothetical protein
VDWGLGIAYMAGAMFLFSAVDTLAKFLTDTLHPVQIAWSRQFGLLLSCSPASKSGGSRRPFGCQPEGTE